MEIQMSWRGGITSPVSAVFSRTCTRVTPPLSAWEQRHSPPRVISMDRRIYFFQAFQVILCVRAEPISGFLPSCKMDITNLARRQQVAAGDEIKRVVDLPPGHSTAV